MPSTSEPRHRVTYYTHRLPERVETQRYTANDGAQLILESAHATLPSVSKYPARVTEKFDIHKAVAADGSEGYILKVRHMVGYLKMTLSSSGTGPASVTHKYCPGDEWADAASKFYPTMDDALICAGDKQTREMEDSRLRDMTAMATEAAGAIDGDGDATAWSRAAYEAACAAAGVDAADDEKVLHTAGVITIPEYHREHVIWVDLARYRAKGIANETATAETVALAQADSAVGVGPYSRDEYETACTAAGIDAIPDAAIPEVTDDHYVAPSLPSRDVLGELRSAKLLGRLPETSARLAMRRRDGMVAELAATRARERAELAEQGKQFATDQQIDTIMTLLARRENSLNGGGFFIGPTDRGGVANLDRESAERYITSLRGEY